MTFDSVKTPLRVLTLLLVFTQVAWAGRIDRGTVWFGVEYTFQDQAMVDEPGRNTISTPHKEAKAKAIAQGIATRLGLSPNAVEKKTSWKPGWFVNVPGDGQWVVNSEPVTIEVNTTPRTIDQLVETAKPIFESTANEGLVAYVNPAAERSGMGHIHVGAAKMGANPFFTNPLLLRNTMVYLHKNPALLHGFAEAFDIGLDSNIETYHTEERQAIFRDIVAEFDAWYDAADARERSNGFNKFLEIMARHDDANWQRAGFFRHYRFMNLEHVKRGRFSADDKGKITIEFRNFRPPKSPLVAKSYAELLMAIMEKQSAPETKEKFEWVSWPEYLRFNTGSKVLANWQEVKKDLGLGLDLRLQAEIKEYADAVQRTKFPSPIAGGELFLAYSRKGEKGEYYELRLPSRDFAIQPVVEIGEHVVDFEKVTVGRNNYWIAILDEKSLGLDHEGVRRGTIRASARSFICRDVFRVAN